MEAARLSRGDKKAYMSWPEPEPDCDITSSPSNPTRHNGMFTAGEHTVMYKYRVQNKFDLECPMTIFVPGELVRSEKGNGLIKISDNYLEER